MPDALLDIIGVVPVQLVFAYALTKMLNIRRLYLFWVLELVFVLLISSFRSSMSVEFRLAASVPLALIPIFLSQGSLARRILVVTLAHLVLFFARRRPVDVDDRHAGRRLRGRSNASWRFFPDSCGSYGSARSASRDALHAAEPFRQRSGTGNGRMAARAFFLGTACSGERDDPFTAR